MDTSELAFTNIRKASIDGVSLLRFLRATYGSVERLHIDFKEKAVRSDSKFADPDRKNLAKAVSGFANSGGGVLVWGIEDKTIKPKPITGIQAFVADSMAMAPTLTDPSVLGIDGFAIQHETDPNVGYGIIHVPESSLPPHRVILREPKIADRYYFRSGSSFVVASHSQLEDMFGRRPKPRMAVELFYVGDGVAGRRFCALNCIVALRNEGRGAAAAPYLSLEVTPPHKISDYGMSQKGEFGLPKLPTPLGGQRNSFGAKSSFVIHSGVTQPVASVKIEIDAKGTYHDVEDLRIDYEMAAIRLDFL